MSAKVLVAGVSTASVVDGVGLRSVLFTQGCLHRCKGCHNESTWGFNRGEWVTLDTLYQQLTVEGALLRGVTLSGGEPTLWAGALIPLVKRLKADGLDIWLYTGYTVEYLLDGGGSADVVGLLRLCDVVVDGPYVDALRSYGCPWRGSTNQRVIDMPATFDSGGSVVLYEGCVND